VIPVLYRQHAKHSIVGISILRHPGALTPMKNPLVPCVGLSLIALIIGCSTSQRDTTQASAMASTVVVRKNLTIQDGRTGEKISWSALLSHISDADVVVLGEQHDDATGHAVQLAVVEDMLDQASGRGGLALEMLERDEQVLVDDYRDEVIDAKTFAKLSESTSWAGEGSWEAWYQPIIDAALERDAIVIAANAPRRYVRLARIGGWDQLDELDARRRVLVNRPDTPITGVYKDRFIELMGGHEEPNLDLDKKSQEVEQAEALERAESFFRSQQVWDATMAASVSAALRQSGPPVMLLVGRFHSDLDGGTPQQIKRLCPSAKIVTISLEPACEEVEFNGDLPQADFIVCTDSARSP
jgi:uncharacterized iron-regulated protein